MKPLTCFIALSSICMVQGIALAQYVGIGTNQPDYQLDVSGRMRIRGGGDLNNSSGIWLNKVNNSGLLAFVGIASENSVGFYGSPGAGWGLSMNTTSGNVGIGTITPNAPLQFASVTLNRKIVLFEGSNNDHEFYGFGVNGNTLRYQTSSAADNHVFYSGATTTSSKELLRIKGNGNIGIGNSNPQRPLSFPATLEKKISLYPGVTGDAGFGVFGNELRIHSDNPSAAITLGVDQYNTGFTELVRIAGNGNVGIGANDPVFRLDINGRIRIRSGGNDASSAGIWLNNNPNSQATAFVGMQSNNLVGFYGQGAGWGFTLNTQYGSLNVGGSPGSSGQVLMSNGNTAAAGWTTLGSLLQYAEGGGDVVKITSGDQSQDVPRSAVSITIGRKSRLLYKADIGGQGPNCLACPNGVARFAVLVNGNIINLTDNYLMTLPNQYIALSPTTRTQGSINISPPSVVLEAGTYTIKVVVSTYLSHQYQPLYNLFAISSSIMAIPVD